MRYRTTPPIFPPKKVAVRSDKPSYREKMPSLPWSFLKLVFVVVGLSIRPTYAFVVLPRSCQQTSVKPNIDPTCVRGAKDTSDHEAFSLRERTAIASTGTDDDSPLPRYLRISSSDTPKGNRRFELQTCVKTFEKKVSSGEPDDADTITVDLHAQVHCADPAYFDYYNDDSKFTSHYDRVHYELVAPKDLLVEDTDGRRRIKEKKSIMPSPSDQSTALQHDLACQVDRVDFSQKKWFCSDYTREEFVEQQHEHGRRGAKNWPLLAGRPYSSSLIPSLPGAEVLQALVRPSTPAQDGLKTRLFSNLFLPGEGIASLIRSLLWFVPVPELSILLLDWSSLSPRAGGISTVASSVVDNFAVGNFKTARKLVFSQLIVSGQANSGEESFIIGKRNELALSELKKSINTDGCRRNALVYGGLHCRDMEKRLEAMGFRSKQTRWRTAWTIDLPGGDTKGRNFAIGTVVVPLYLVVSGLDWLATLQDVGNSLEGGESQNALAVAAAYLLRHVALYFSLAKFVVEWDVGLFENED